MRNSINECFPNIDNVPQIVNLVKPYYPKDTKDADIKGTTKVKVWTDDTGKPLFDVIFESLNKIFNKQSLILLMSCIFKPATMHNKLKGAWLIFPYKFKLK